MTKSALPNHSLPNNSLPNQSLPIRSLLSLCFAQACYTACMPIAFIVGSLTAVRLAGGDGRFAGVPSALLLASAALGAFGGGRLAHRWGYRRVLPLACALGIGAALVAALGASSESLWIFLGAFFPFGLATGMLGLSRYAAAEASPPAFRARAIGWVVAGSTLGALIGPWIASQAGSWAEHWGQPSVLGPWMAVMGFWFLAAIDVWLFLRPEPHGLHPDPLVSMVTPQMTAVTSVVTLPVISATSDKAMKRESQSRVSGELREESGHHTLGELLRLKNVQSAIASLLSAQVAMVLVMTITPHHMQCHQHGLEQISITITFHLLGMYGLSFFSGFLTDRLGRRGVMGLGGVILVVSCLLAPLSPAFIPLTVSLFLLGLGWNFCLLGASATLVDGLTGKERGKLQGANEALINLSSSAAGLSSGLLTATLGFTAMVGVGLVFSLIPCLLFFRNTPPKPMGTPV
jgi:MFS family permease